MKKQNVLDARW